MASLMFEGKPVASYEALVRGLPQSSCASTSRSTLPLIDFWRDPEMRVSELSALIKLELKPPIELHFEYAVPVLQGRGKASFTDLMVIARNAAVAIEAKFTEPPYEPLDYYIEALSALSGMLDGNGLSFHVLSCPVTPLPKHLAIEQQFANGTHDLACAVRDALASQALFHFGEVAIHNVSGTDPGDVR